MKKIIKYMLIIVAAFIVIAVILYGALIFFMAMMFSGGTTAEKRQDELGRTAQQQIINFYDKNNYYPKSLYDLPLSNDKDFVRLLENNHTFRYRTYDADKKSKSKYVFYWRGGAMQWTGYRCTNDELALSQKEHGVISTYTMPGGTVCTVTDLH